MVKRCVCAQCRPFGLDARIESPSPQQRISIIGTGVSRSGTRQTIMIQLSGTQEKMKRKMMAVITNAVTTIFATGCIPMAARAAAHAHLNRRPAARARERRRVSSGSRECLCACARVEGKICARARGRNAGLGGGVGGPRTSPRASSVDGRAREACEREVFGVCSKLVWCRFHLSFFPFPLTRGKSFIRLRQHTHCRRPASTLGAGRSVVPS